MDLSAPRRKPNTYGKSTRKVFVHNLFDAATESTSSNVGYVSEERESAQQLKQELKLAANHKQQIIQESTERPSQITSDAPPNLALYDVESSDEEHERPKIPATSNKRRKLASKKPRNGHDEVEPQSRSKINPKTKPVNQIRKTEMPKENYIRDNSSTSDPQESTAKLSTSASITATSIPNVLDKVATTKSHAGRQQQTSTNRPRPNLALRKSPVRGKSPASDVSTVSKASTRSTPKRKRQNGEDGASDVSSPSHLELSSLRFTPERSLKDKLWGLDMDQSDSSTTSPKRPRSRLIDRLDIEDSNDTQNIHKSHNELSSAVVTKSSSASNLKVKPQLERTTSSSSAPGLSKPRTTYGKQRSHLNDMVDSLENESRMDSQPLYSHFTTQIDPLNRTGPPFDLDGFDSDEQPTGSQLKSIHELRQAGAVNRFERDLDTLCEDIEATSKSLRLQGLMQLVRKLQEQAFKRHLLESGKLQRVLACAKSDLDLPSSVVLLLALWTLIVSDVCSAKTSRRIYQTLLTLRTSLLSETRSIEMIARDRNENLSKALVTDLSDFETHVLRQSVQNERQNNHIITSRVALRCFEYAVRKLSEFREQIPETPLNVYSAMLDVLDEQSLDLNDPDTGERIESLRLVLSWFELSSSSLETSHFTSSATLYRKLGRTLARVMKWARVKNNVIEQSCLRLVVSLSNLETSVCDHLASNTVMNEILAVIDSHFMQLADTASEETEMDNDKLDSVILALGCLLNLAECSELARMNFMTVNGLGQMPIDQLVTIFNKYVDETTEAVSFGQTQVMVAFGYLSMLLCTLCIDTSAREHLTQTIKGKNLDELFKAVDIFLTHMNAVEIGLDGENSSPGFAERFDAILERVKSVVST